MTWHQKKKQGLEGKCLFRAFVYQVLESECLFRGFCIGK